MIDLMIPPIVAALVILSIHAYLGLHVIGREVIFVDLAFAQIAALGTTVAFLLGFEQGSTLSLLFALGATFTGALIFSFTRMEKSAVPQEAIIGITFVVASAAVILFSGFTAEGTEHLRDTMTGTLIWVDWGKIGSMAGIYAVIGVFHFVLRKKFLTITFRPERARNIRFWDFLFYASFGIVISYSVDIAGVLMVFSSLVIPAVIAFFFTSRFTTALVIAWLAGAVAILGGIGASFYWDVATGPLLVCSFGIVLTVAGILKKAFRVHPASEIVVTALLEEEPAADARPLAGVPELAQ